MMIFGDFERGSDANAMKRFCEGRGVRVEEFTCESIGDFECVEQSTAEVEPDAVFHLASRPDLSEDAIAANARNIVSGTWNICEAVRRRAPRARTFFAGSGSQFENRGRPIDENAPFTRNSAYALQQNQAVETVRHFRGRGVKTYIGYLFHQESPFVRARDLALQLANDVLAVASGELDQIRIGDVRAEKEWCCPLEVAEGMWTLVGQDRVLEAVIGSGDAQPISRWLELCFDCVRLDWRDHVQLDDEDPPAFERMVSDPHTMRRLGWSSSADLRALSARVMADAERCEGGTATFSRQ